MKKLTLIRKTHTTLGTKGILECKELGLGLFSLENPWLNNQRQVSCIPLGTYSCQLVDSPRFGRAYEVLNVPDRTHILFHVGNYPTDTLGCILLGTVGSTATTQMFIGNSRLAMEEFKTKLRDEPFELEIINEKATDTFGIVV